MAERSSKNAVVFLLLAMALSCYFVFPVSASSRKLAQAMKQQHKAEELASQTPPGSATSVAPLDPAAATTQFVAPDTNSNKLDSAPAEDDLHYVRSAPNPMHNNVAADPPRKFPKFHLREFVGRRFHLVQKSGALISSQVESGRVQEFLSFPVVMVDDDDDEDDDSRN
ncbi:hypothetical protein SELMODRAFT_431015 [Selaginella moellendorffii]|uniref:Transmembrane protein n=1 Tax=Selaginella moellendorffii TaxID=88036 RepID=D8TB91_SELML|nr:hypothetical protein SELMODRAFT_431015 [Selaginella moellendorffii]